MGKGRVISLNELPPAGDDPARGKLAINDTQAQVLEAMHVGSRAGVYVIGPFPTRVNFASQQMRAFNLVWALTDNDGPVNSDAKVAVIGAGLAGLTAAAALHRRGVEAHVFEQRGDLMPLQRGTTSRYVNPTLNYWPQVEFGPATSFPFLNWGADVCERIISAVETEWRRDFAQAVPVHTQSTVLGIQPHSNQFVLELDGGDYKKGYSTVIVAVGFGLEAPVKGALAPSYWQDVDTRVVRSSSSGDFVISGGGDGGILEVLRLAYGDFEQGQLTARVTRWANRTAAREVIAEAEMDAAQILDDHERAKALGMVYLTMDLDPELEAFLDAKLARGSKVTLIVRGGSAFTLESAPVHRLMLAHAIRRQRVSVHLGDFAVDENGAATRVDKDGNLLEAYPGRPYVVRHGPAGELGRLLTEPERRVLAKPQSVLSPYQFRPLWPPGYFARTGASSQQEQEEMFETLKALRPSLLREYPGLMHVQLGKSGDELVCQFVVDRNSSAFRDDEAPRMLLGKRVEILRQGWTFGQAGQMAARSGAAGEGGRRPLRAGDLIQASKARPAGGGSGVIGCFVQRHRDDVAFALTAGHVLGEDAGTEVYATGPEVIEWRLVGTVAPRSREVWDDVAAIQLIDDVAFEVASEDGSARITPTLGLLGETVHRVGRDGQRIEAMVTALAAGVRFRVNGDEKVLPEAVVVSQAGAPFAQPGDSGTIVRREDNSIIGVIVAANDDAVFVGPIKGAVSEVGGAIAGAGRAGAPLIAEPSTPVRFGVVGEVIEPAAAKEMVAQELDLAAIREERDRLRELLHSDWLADADTAGVLWRPLIRELDLTAPVQLTVKHRLRESRFFLHSESDFMDLAKAAEFAERRLFYVPIFMGITPRLWRRFASALEGSYAAPGIRVHAELGTSPQLRLAAREYANVAKGRPLSLHAAVLTLDLVALTAGPGVLQSLSGPSDVAGLPDLGFDVWRVGHPEPAETYASAIEPAIYSLEGWEGSSNDPLPRRRDVAVEISRRLGRAWAPLLEEMLRGHLVTLGTAMIVQGFFAELGFDFGQVQASKPENLRRARAAYSERAARRATGILPSDG